MLWAVGCGILFMGSSQQHDEDGFLTNPETPFHDIGSWSVQQSSTVYMEPFRFDYQVFSMDLHLKKNEIKTFRGRVQASHEEESNEKQYGASKQSLAAVMKTRPFSLECVFVRGICHLRYQSPYRWEWINQHMNYKPGDIVVATFPKSGTTWTEHIILLLLGDGDDTQISKLSRHMPKYDDQWLDTHLFKIWFERDLGKFRLSDESARKKLSYFERLKSVGQGSKRRFLLRTNSSAPRRQMEDKRQLRNGGRTRRPGGRKQGGRNQGGRKSPQGGKGGRKQGGGGRKQPTGPVVDPLPVTGPAIDNRAMKGRRLIKTHAPRNIFIGNNGGALPSGIKVVYVVRNPKDQAVSMFYQEFHNSANNKRMWPFDAWLSFWFSGNAHYGSWFHHIKTWWDAYQLDAGKQVLWVPYEDMKRDPGLWVGRIAKHIGVEADEKLIAEVVLKSSVEYLKSHRRHLMETEDGDEDGEEDEEEGERRELNNAQPKKSSGNKLHVRKGITGDWRNHFTRSLSDEFDKMFKREMRDRALCGLQKKELVFDLGNGDSLSC